MVCNARLRRGLWELTFPRGAITSSLPTREQPLYKTPVTSFRTLTHH
jgi:hypothetical protein